jgi:hypothetical protein
MEAALWRDVPPTHVQVAGIAVRDSTITDLALLLSEAGNSTLANTSGNLGPVSTGDASPSRECVDILPYSSPSGQPTSNRYRRHCATASTQRSNQGFSASFPPLAKLSRIAALSNSSRPLANLDGRTVSGRRRLSDARRFAPLTATLHRLDLGLAPPVGRVLHLHPAALPGRGRRRRGASRRSPPARGSRRCRRAPGRHRTRRRVERIRSPARCPRGAPGVDPTGCI